MYRNGEPWQEIHSLLNSLAIRLYLVLKQIAHFQEIDRDYSAHLHVRLTSHLTLKCTQDSESNTGLGNRAVIRMYLLCIDNHDECIRRSVAGGRSWG